LTCLLEIAEVSRAGYYKWRKARERASHHAQQEHILKDHIMAIHRLHPYYGYLRMTVALRKEGFLVNHKRVYRLMKELGIRSVIRKKRRFFGKQQSVVFPNRLNRKFSAAALNKKWVTDVTYLPINGGFVYLSAIQDLYNNEIIAYHVSKRNDLSLVMKTLEKACENREVVKTLIHSDQGFQYTSRQYSKKLEQLGMVGSHSRKGNCLDNACIESFFSHLKSEMLLLQCPETLDELYRAIDQYITFYNHERSQKRLGDRSPVEYREAIAA
jgi:transposase InsO family protein